MPQKQHNLPEINPNDYSWINENIIESIKDEYALQGHRVTGATEESLKNECVFENGKIILTASGLDHIEALEDGGYSPSDENDVTLEKKVAFWLVNKGLANSVSDAVASSKKIIKYWADHGKPSQNSRAFSQTGEILHAIQISISQREELIYDEIDNEVYKLLDKEFNHVKPGKP